MKIKITGFLFFYCFFQTCFSQNIKGKVVSNGLPVQEVEVINISSKDVVKTNTEGAFEIKATTSNWITFYHKEYDIVKVYVDSLFDFNKSLEIEFFQKSTTIEEVIVEKQQPFLKGLKTGMPLIPNNKPSVAFNDGSIPNGMNFMAIGKLIVGLFKSKDTTPYKPKEPVQFRTFTAQSYTNDFLISSLKIKPEEIEEFLNFCSFDPNSKEAVENSDKMTLLQFLITKSEEYKKIYQKE
ncbi:transthyretin-like family protein [Flavobacterium difficile]|uniref:Uncharacterized protein n=1 Tax=Flavobacterium difficile TaxID=2709659 RepID=A0ABX0I3E5_9FLAO|nr:hypothetical protein [Flavobacterium difficile]NHM01710.1 hypothetical protein [Flavobacterium difficile]